MSFASFLVQTLNLTIMKVVKFLLILICICSAAQAQKKILVLGSSTSTCFFGPSTLDNCYLTMLQKHFESAGTPIVFDNRAVAGDNCYQGMPLNYTPPPGRSTPRPFNNITEGLQGNPDIVLVNFPSNGYDVFSVDEVMYCLRTIRQTANNAGKPCYITTSQPRNDPESFRTAETRMKMGQIKDRVLGEFGNFAINFWDEIVDPADNTIKPQYNADGTHLNDAGHRVLFSRVRDRNILGSNTQPPATGNGLNYRYYEGNWNSLPDFNSITPVKTGTSANLDLSVRNRNDNFGMVWQGSIQIPVSGNYIFELSSDDGSRFYLNSGYNPYTTPLLNNDGLHGDQDFVSASVYLNAGTYPIAASFFEAYGNESFKLLWSGPGISRQEVPNSAFGAAPQTGSGLNYRYYEGDWNSLPDFNALSPVKSGQTGSIDLGPRNRNDYFAFLWEGFLSIPSSGNYTFELESDDGSQFFFNSTYHYGATPTVNNDGLHGVNPAAAASLYINAGTYPVAAGFFEKWGDETMRLYWSGPGIERQLIPASAFSRTASSVTSTLPGLVNLKSATDMEAGVPLVYPNPFRDKVKLDINVLEDSRDARFEIYDRFGRLVQKQSLDRLKKGRAVIDIPVPGLPPNTGGVYVLKLIIGNLPVKTFKLFQQQ